MKFSVIIPVYNVEDYLRVCIDSVLAQQYQDYEVILVDDGSTDSSGVICDEYADISSKVKVFHQRNQGSSGARNTGLRHAMGEWILFVDSDDWVSSEMMSILADEIHKSSADMIMFNMQKCSQLGNPKEKLIYTPENRRWLFADEKQKFRFSRDIFLQYKCGWEAWNKAFKRSIIDQFGLMFYDMDKVFAEDLLFTYQYLMLVQDVYQLCDILYFYRQREESLSHQRDMRSIIIRLEQLAEEAFSFVKKNDFRYTKRNFYMLYYVLLDYHIRYPLKSLTVGAVREQLQICQQKKLHRRWIKQINRHKTELEIDAGSSNWL